MEIEHKTRVVNSFAALEKLLGQIESGRKAKPDWIRLQSNARLGVLETDVRERLLRRLHGCVLRGFKANNVEFEKRKHLLAYWQSVARSGFHDFSELGWMKSYDSPFIENYDYIEAFKENGL
ncbi:hypothetical protein MK280_14995, partial [Myxococcota bacterium]|nr:hypothetical protein [Myxococcota bacterium]